MQTATFSNCFHSDHCLNWSFIKKTDPISDNVVIHYLRQVNVMNIEKG